MHQVVTAHIDAFAGTVVAPGDYGWDAARQAFNLAVDQRPSLIAIPADEQDVAAAVRFARANGLQVAPQRTGHNAAPLGVLDGVLLLKTDALGGVEIDAERRIARVRAAARWEDVVPQASELGLAALHGSAPDVGVVGYSLGGGMGWYARKLGLSANSVTAIELVTADGELVRADADHEPELFWALRGGGGNFGVVTAIELRLHRMPRVHAGALFYPWERSAEVLGTWNELRRALPDEMTSIGRIMQFPPLEEIPEPMRGNAFAIVEAVHAGDAREADALLEPLRELGPALDTFATVAPAGISGLHMDPTEPVPAATATQILDDLPADAIDALVAAAGPGSGSPLVSVELRHMGGALERSAPDHGALATLPGSFAMFAVGVTPEPAAAVVAREQLAKVRAALAEHEIGAYWNFVEEPTDTARFFDDETYARLREVKWQYDPEGVFRANHPIAPAAQGEEHP